MCNEHIFTPIHRSVADIAKAITARTYTSCADKITSDTFLLISSKASFIQVLVAQKRKEGDLSGWLPMSMYDITTTSWQSNKTISIFFMEIQNMTLTLRYIIFLGATKLLVSQSLRSFQMFSNV